MTELSVLTWNIFWGLGGPNDRFHHWKLMGRYLRPWHDRYVVEDIGRLIRQAGPDIVALQEVDAGSPRNRNFDQLEVLSSLSGLGESAYCGERELRFLRDGNAIMSAFGLDQVDVAAIPYFIERRNRILAYPQVGHKVAVINTHLGAHGVMEVERVKQASDIARLVSALDCPVILLGDFNCPPGSKPMQVLCSVGLRPLNMDPTYPSYNPVYCFDNVLVTSEFDVLECGVLANNRSDHLPVYARLKID